MIAFYLQDNFFSQISHLLISTGKQYLLSPGPENKVLLWEGTGTAWEKPRPLPLLQERLCATLDKNLIPHLVTMSQGHFYHLTLLDDKEREPPPPFYRDKNKQCHHFLLAGDRQDTLHLIHSAVDRAAKRWWLMHHRCHSGTWEEPQVIDFGPGSREKQSALTIDDRDCLHLLYRSNSAGQDELSYRQFDPDAASWSKAEIISNSPGAAHPSLAADENQNLHLLWSSAVDDKHYIFYRFRGGPGWKSRGWAPETALSPAAAEPPFPFFSRLSGELLLSWLEKKTLFRYRFSGDHWEQMAEQHFEKPQLVRCSSFSLEGTPLHYWIAAESGRQGTDTLSDALLPACGYDDLEGDLSRLNRYSGKVFQRMEDLSTDKEQLEEELRSKHREMFHLSRQNDQQVRLLRENLQGKEAELQKLQQELTQIIDNLKKKNEQTRQTREAERKRFRSVQQEHNAKIRRLENELSAKDKIIARLELREREQLALMEQLRQENEKLKPKQGAIRRNFKKLREQLFPPKKR